MLGTGKLSCFYSILLRIILLLPMVSSQIPLGSKLSVEEKNHWVSPNGDFAIGFFNRSNEYGIGIRISSGSIPAEKQPVVWVAGGDLRVGDKSYFELTKTGELVLFDSTRGVTVWASKTTNSSVDSAVLQDNGNLVLLKKNKDIVWQSFDTPSDTLLPGQNLSSNQVLRAASRNSISSYYSLRIGLSGDLELKWENDVVYWRSAMFPSQSALRAVLASDGAFQLFDHMSSPIWSVFSDDHGELDVKFRVLKLDVDGNLRLRSWSKNSTSWKLVWQAVENQCDVFATCGLTGICSFNESKAPVCKCPFSLSPQSSSKCLLPYQQGCKSGSSMVKLDHTSLYAIYPPNETIVSQVSSTQCQNLCQKDHLCTAATFMNDGTSNCKIKKTQYASGQSGLSITSVSFVKICTDPIAVIPNLTKSKPESPSQNTPTRQDHLSVCVSCVLGVGGGTIIVFIVIHLGLMGFWIYRKRYSFTTPDYSTYNKDGPNPSGFLALSYSEMKDITDNFKHRVGSNTYKGILPEKQPVLVKDYSTANIDPRKFRCGILKLGSIHHRNLVRLEGYCCESSYRFLVYEYLQNGSLAKCLEDPVIARRLTWRKRLDLCLAVARAVSYLHMGCREFVGHGSLSCENVVLDENLDAKVSEYGLTSFLGDGPDGGGGSAGDIRDFGYVVLAVLSGVPNGGCDWAYEKWAGGNAAEIVNETIDGGVDGDELERVLRIMFWCLQSDERMRPTMGEIVNVLEGAMAVDAPPPPSACRREPGAEEYGSGSESDV
ncbi:hypothetical protein SSX86_026572 [Deinandra increscens subsp. villosa]|uniref:Receptor-like serine/threonine-protein kinase n=1 Tax=Deinandra increscens subsp. villosa TaxID=3103831 RepID=A0AAP0CES8_9ASTR